MATNAIRRRSRVRGHGSGRGRMLALLLATVRALSADYWSVYELAEHLGVDKRTAWRLIAAIRAQCSLERCREAGPGAVSYYRLPRRWWEAEKRQPRIRRT